MNPRFYPALRRRLALFLLSGILPLTVFAQNVSVNWTGGNSGRSWLGPTNWSPQIVPLNGGGTNFTVIVPDSSSLVYDSSSAGTIDALSLGSSSLLTANGGGGLVVTGPTILRSGVAANGSGSAFSATSIQTVFNGAPYLIATSGGRIGVAASTYTWPYYNGSFTLLNCNGSGSRIDLTNLTSFAVTYGDSGSWTYSVIARSNGVIDLSNLTQITGGSQDDWLDFNMDATGDILLDSVGRTAGQVRFTSSRPFYELPVLRTATGSFIVGANSLLSLPALIALSSGAISVSSNGSVVAPQLLTLDAVGVSLGTNASVIATNLSAYRNSDISFAPGRDFQYGQLTDVYASRISAIGGATGRIAAISYDTPADWRWSPTLFSADGTGSLLDCSSMTSLRVRYGGGYNGSYNYYFTAKNGGVIDFSSVQSIIGPEEGDDWINMTVSNGGTVRLPNLQQIIRQLILNVQLPLYTLPTLSSANGTVINLGTGNRLDLPQLRSFTGSSIGWGFNSTLYAPNLVDVSYSAISLAPGRNWLAPPLTNVFASQLSVSGGSTLTVAASSYDTPADWRWSPTLFSADGAGSLLDCSSMTSLRVRYGGGYNGSYNYYFTANNGGVIDLSGIQTIIGPEEGDDWINMTVSNGGTVRLPNLQQIVRQLILNVQVPLYTLPALTSANGTVFNLGTGNRLDLPQLRSFTGSSIGWGFGSTLYAPNLVDVSYSAISLAPGRNLLAPPPTNVFASQLSVSGGSTFTVVASSYDTPADWRWSPTLLSADGAGSLLDCSSMTSLRVHYGGGYNGSYAYYFTANNGAVLDLSGLTAITGPEENDDWLVMSAGSGANLKLGNTLVYRQVQINANGAGTRFTCAGLYLRPIVTVSFTGKAVLELQGDWAYESTDANSIVIDNASLQMDGRSPQHFEVGGRDSGPNGFTSRNFGCSQLVVGHSNQTSVVKLVDTLNNGNRGAGGEPEALYLYGLDGAGLRLFNGSRLLLNGINCYASIGGQMTSLRSLIPAGSNSVPFDAGVIAFAGGPRITNMTPAIALTPPVSAVDVSFDIPIDATTFSTGDISISGPAGAISPSSISLVSGTTYRIGFAPQATDGVYTARVGPLINELAGNLTGMDQNGDGLAGDGTNDVFGGTFMIDGTAPLIAGAYALQSGNSIGLTFDEPVSPSFATNPANYRVNGAPPSQAALQTNGSAVILTVSPVVGETFSLVISNATDLVGNQTHWNVSGTILSLLPTVLGTAGSDPLVVGSTTPFGPATFLDIAGGSSIWGTADHGRFTFEPRTGNFDLRVRLESLTRPGSWTEAGLMARESTNANSRHVYMNVEYGTGYNRHIAGYRATTGGSAAYWPGGSYTATVPIPNAWMRLKREGDVFIAFRGTNGVAWTEYARLTNALPQTLLVGLASSAVNNAAGQATTASYREFSDFSPSLLTQPLSQTVTSGVSVVFGVTARGLPALGYQWYQNGLILAGQTSALLTLNNVTTNQAGDYFAVVTNPYGATTSQVATLVVDGLGLGGFEADVAPLPNGNNTVSVSDWVRLGRLVAGLETPLNSGDFVRADCAPRTNASTGTLPLGNGFLSVADWTQAGRYAAGLDPLTAAGGPAQSGGFVLTPIVRSQGGEDRAVQVMNARTAQGQTVKLTVNLAGLGNENALGFSLTYNPAALVYQRTSLASGAVGCSLQINEGQAGAGRLGLVLAKPVGQSFAAAVQPLLQVEFSAIGAPGETAVGFGDTPVLREIADPGAAILDASFLEGTVTIVQPPHLDAAVRSAGSGAELRLTGAPGETYRIEVSSDLLTWKFLANAVAGSQPVTIADPAAAQQSQRFYRASPAP